MAAWGKEAAAAEGRAEVAGGMGVAKAASAAIVAAEGRSRVLCVGAERRAPRTFAQAAVRCLCSTLCKMMSTPSFLSPCRSSAHTVTRCPAESDRKSQCRHTSRSRGTDISSSEPARSAGRRSCRTFRSLCRREVRTTCKVHVAPAPLGRTCTPCTHTSSRSVHQCRVVSTTWNSPRTGYRWVVRCDNSYLLRDKRTSRQSRAGRGTMSTNGTCKTSHAHRCVRTRARRALSSNPSLWRPTGHV